MGTNERKRKLAVKQGVTLVIITIAAFLLFPTIEQALRQGETMTVRFRRADGSRSAEFTLDIAATSAARAKGLMFRRPEDMGANEGMLFIFPDEGQRSFWMKNTLIPLDMIFVASDKSVVGILSDVPPMNEQPRTLPAASQYVIELHAGTARKEGVVEGSHVEFGAALPPAS